MADEHSVYIMLGHQGQEAISCCLKSNRAHHFGLAAGVAGCEQAEMGRLRQAEAGSIPGSSKAR